MQTLWSYLSFAWPTLFDCIPMQYPQENQIDRTPLSKMWYQRFLWYLKWESHHRLIKPFSNCDIVLFHAIRKPQISSHVPGIIFTSNMVYLNHHTDTTVDIITFYAFIKLIFFAGESPKKRLYVSVGYIIIGLEKGFSYNRRWKHMQLYKKLHIHALI